MACFFTEVFTDRATTARLSELVRGARLRANPYRASASVPDPRHVTVGSQAGAARTTSGATRVSAACAPAAGAEVGSASGARAEAVRLLNLSQRLLPRAQFSDCRSKGFSPRERSRARAWEARAACCLLWENRVPLHIL